MLRDAASLYFYGNLYKKVKKVCQNLVRVSDSPPS